MKNEVKLYVGESLGKYGFPDGHPFGHGPPGRVLEGGGEAGLDKRAAITDPRMAAEEELHRFHTPKHVAWVKEKSEEGHGAIDYGDTPACPGIYEAAATVAGSALHGLDTHHERRRAAHFPADRRPAPRAARQRRRDSACSTTSAS